MKVTQAELAKRTKTTKSYISKIENEIVTPSVDAFLPYYCGSRHED